MGNGKRVTSRGLLVLKDDDGKDCLALVHRLKPSKENPEIIADYYVTPGGGVEEGEDIEGTAVREIEEELGIQAEPLKLLYTQESEENIHNYFICKYVSGTFGTGTGPEFNDPEYVSIKGKYIPTLVPLTELNGLELAPNELKESLYADLVATGFDIEKIEYRDISKKPELER